jgi:hypothetical protein
MGEMDDSELKFEARELVRELKASVLHRILGREPKNAEIDTALEFQNKVLDMLTVTELVNFAGGEVRRRTRRRRRKGCGK